MAKLPAIRGTDVVRAFKALDRVSHAVGVSHGFSWGELRRAGGRRDLFWGFDRIRGFLFPPGVAGVIMLASTRMS